MNPANRLGIALRRLGSVTAIRRVRSEHAERTDNHGGALSELNDRLMERARLAEAHVLHVEKEVLG